MLMKLVGVVDVVEGEVVVVFDSVVCGQVVVVVEYVFDVWWFDDVLDVLFVMFVVLFNIDMWYDVVMILVLFGGVDVMVVVLYVVWVVCEGVIDGVQVVGDMLWFIVLCMMFWQNLWLWLKVFVLGGMLLCYVIMNGYWYLVWLLLLVGEIYVCSMLQVGMMFSLCIVDIDVYVDLFSGWMNFDCVVYFWDQCGMCDEYVVYLVEWLVDLYMYLMIGYFDDMLFGYFEFYWVKEDCFVLFYDVYDYDCGLYLLIGDLCFQSVGKLYVWWSGVLYYMFVDELCMQWFVGELCVDYVWYIVYMYWFGFYMLKEFDFLYKCVVFMVIECDMFFDIFWLL